jgi:hypothetical protein
VRRRLGTILLGLGAIAAWGQLRVGPLAETGPSAGTLTMTILALLVVGSACLVIERRHRPLVERVTGFEREALLPARST